MTDNEQEEKVGKSPATRNTIDYSKVFPVATVKRTIEEASDDSTSSWLLSKASAERVGATAALWLHELIHLALVEAKESSDGGGGDDGDDDINNDNTKATMIRVEHIQAVLEAHERYQFLDATCVNDCQAHEETTRQGGQPFRPPKKRQKTTAKKKNPPPETKDVMDCVSTCREDLMKTSQVMGEVEVDEEDYD